MSRQHARTPREVAFDVLLAVHDDDAYANLLLPKRLAKAGLRGADAAFATELTYGTLREQGLYDWLIERAAKRPVGKIDAVALLALRLGAHQLLGMRVAPHAAVNETVNLVRGRAGRGPAGFVNANLRAIGRHSRADWLRMVAAEVQDAPARLAIERSHPRWIVTALADALAREGAADELDELLAADNVAPAVQLAALPGRSQRDDLADGALLTAHPAAPTALELLSGDPHEVPAVAEHRARVQDAGSQLVALALTRAEQLRPGERLLDLCAGPGGKTALLLAEAQLAGAEVVANELVPARAGLVRQAIAPFASNTVVTELNGLDYGRRVGEFDRVLVDAPCTGLGALRRRPEARWRKQESDVTELAALQRELLIAAITATKPAGLVAYVTCSPHPAETTAVVADVLDTGVQVLDTRAIVARIVPELAFGHLPIGTGTAVQLWPHRHGTDAMFLTLLRTPSERLTA